MRRLLSWVVAVMGVGAAGCQCVQPPDAVYSCTVDADCPPGDHCAAERCGSIELPLPPDSGRDAGAADSGMPDASVHAESDAGVDAGRSGGIRFDGDGGYLQLPTLPVYMSDAGFSWELWFKGESLPSSSSMGRGQTLIGVMDSTMCQDTYLGFGSGFSSQRQLTLVSDRGGDGGCSVRDVDPVRVDQSFINGQWYHVVGVRDFGASTSALFVNGELAATKSLTGPPVFSPSPMANVGRWFDGTGGGSAWFKGAVDEVRLYNRALSANEVRAHYGGGLGQHGLPELGLAVGYHFDETDGGPYAHDYSGNTHRATLMGGTTRVDGIVPLP